LFLAQGDESEPRPTAVWLHGIPGIEQNHDLAIYFRERGWNSLIFHYRGCWGSEGDYDIRTIPEDITAAFDYLCSGAFPQIDRDRLILGGHSLGGWATVFAGAQEPRAKALVSMGGVMIPQWMPMIAEYAEAEFVPWLATTGEAIFEQWGVLGSEMRPEDVVNSLERPLLLVHGTDDAAVGPSHSSKLASLATGIDCTYHPIEGADHGFSWHRPELIETIWAWVSKQGI